VNEPNIVLKFVLPPRNDTSEGLYPGIKTLTFHRFLYLRSGRPSWVRCFTRFRLCGAIMSMSYTASSVRSKGSESYALSPIRSVGVVFVNLLSTVLSTQGDFARRSTSHTNGDWKRAFVCNNHDLGAFPTFRRSHTSTPFLAEAKVPSMKHSWSESFPRPSISSASSLRITSSTPRSTHS
jgi:hypothetical protein